MTKMTIREWIARNPTIQIGEIFSNYGDSRFGFEEAFDTDLDEDIVEIYYCPEFNSVDIEI